MSYTTEDVLHGNLANANLLKDTIGSTKGIELPKHGNRN